MHSGLTSTPAFPSRTTRTFPPFAGRRGRLFFYVLASLWLIPSYPAKAQLMPDGSCFEVPPQGWAWTDKGILVVNLTLFPIDKRPFDKLLKYKEWELGLKGTHLLPGWSLSIVIHTPSIDFTPVAGTGRVSTYIPWPWACGPRPPMDCTGGYYESGSRIIHIPLPLSGDSFLMHELEHHVRHMWGLPDEMDFPYTPAEPER